MPTKLTTLILGLVVLLLLPMPYLTDVKAVVDNCSVVQKDRTMSANQTKNLGFDITNLSSSSIVWVRISAPSGFEIKGASTSGFSASFSSSSATFSSGSLAPTSNQNFSVTVTSGNSAQSAASFGVEASDSDSGSSPASCSGNTSVEITSQGSLPTFTSISASSITQSSATISWTTSAPTTGRLTVTLDGATVQNPSDNTMQSSHTFNLIGLASGTVYHYVVSGSDSSNNTITSGESTFLTLSPGEQPSIKNAPPTSGSSASTSNGTRVRKPKNIPSKPDPKPVPDKTPPEIELTTDFSKSYKTPPNLKGNVKDENGFSELFYSLDDGKNWIPASLLSQTTFDITPTTLEDGNYPVKILAKDPSGNIGQSKTSILIIDILPPKIGPSLISLGPQIISPNPDHITYLLEGLDHKISLPAAGGPSKIDLSIEGSTNQTFSLSKNLDTNLWEGALNFSKPGLYQLIAKTVDGMDNNSDKKVNKIYVLESGQVQDKSSKQGIEGAEVTLYRYDQVLKNFQKWQAEGYDQKNPLKTDKNGKYALYPPAGKYYLKVSKSGYKEIKSQIFELTQSQPINTNLHLEKGTLFNLAFLSSLIDVFRSHPQISLATPPNVKNLDAPKLPLKLPKIDSKSLGLSYDLANRPEVIVSVLNSWSPQTFEQIIILEKISTDKNLEIVAIFPLEGASKIDIFQKRGGYTLDMTADPKGILIDTLNPISTPSHYFLKQGILQKIKYGLLTDKDLGDNLK